MQMHMEFLQANKNLFMKLSLEVQRLKLESQNKIQEKCHAYQELIRALIDEGIREGVFRKVDSLLAARIMIISIVPAVFTSRPTGASQETVMQTMDIFFKGIEM